MHNLRSEQAVRRTFELVATTGPAPEDLDALFAPLQPDPRGTLDGVRDTANMPLAEEPEQVRDDLKAVTGGGINS